MIAPENKDPKPPVQLPPELQLLYDSLCDKIDKIDWKMPDDFSFPKHASDVEEMKLQQVELKSRINRVECENCIVEAKNNFNGGQNVGIQHSDNWNIGR